MTKRITQILFMLCLGSMFCRVQAQNMLPESGSPLRGVTTVQIDPTVIPNPPAVKEPSAANLLQDSLRNAFHLANIESSDGASIRAHVILEEFTSGSAAKRFLVGLGAGRSSITCHLVIEDGQGKELLNKKIHVRGALAFSPYEGNNTQRRQAVNSLDQRILEEIERAK